VGDIQSADAPDGQKSAAQMHGQMLRHAQPDERRFYRSAAEDSAGISPSDKLLAIVERAGTEFFAPNRHLRRGLNTHPNCPPGHSYDRYDDVVIDNQPLVLFAR